MRNNGLNGSRFPPSYYTKGSGYAPDMLQSRSLLFNTGGSGNVPECSNQTQSCSHQGQLQHLRHAAIDLVLFALAAVATFHRCCKQLSTLAGMQSKAGFGSTS